MTDTTTLWNTVLVEVELNVSKANFNTWFRDTHILKIEDGVVYLSVPNTFAKEWLSGKYHKFILKSLRESLSDARSIEYVVTKEGERKKQEVAQQSAPSINASLPLQEHYINKDDNLNPRYTFDSFVVGPFNELAHAASQAIVKTPGSVYNPLFVYGNTGHGKTHLIQAVGNQIKKENPNKKVFYVTSEKFALDYINSLQTNKVNAFKEKYRKYDVLIMDDIQFFSKTEKTQEELFHLFNTLYESNRQIIFSSDKHPHYIPNLEERLKSRFGAGMIVDIPSPDHESRVAIITSKSKQLNFFISPEVTEYLAGAIEGNVRELEGALNTIVCHTQLKGKDLGITEIKNLIKDSAKPKKMVSVKEVIKTIADFYNIDEASIYEKTRRKEVVKPRQMIMYVLREDFDVSYPSIGEKLGGRDHTTVIHSCEKVKNDLKDNDSLAQELKQIRAILV